MTRRAPATHCETCLYWASPNRAIGQCTIYLPPIIAVRSMQLFVTEWNDGCDLGVPQTDESGR